MHKNRMAVSAALVLAFVAGSPALAAGSLADRLKGVVDSAKDSATPGPQAGSQGELSSDEIGQGLREALRVGAEKAVSQASGPGGFLDNPRIRIPLPGNLQKGGDLLKKVGMGSQVTAFEETMNRAAEKASAKALPIFQDAVSKLTFQDVQRIWKGGDTAATAHLKQTTRGRLYDEFRPVVHDAAQSVGVTRSYEQLTSRPEIKPLASGGQLDLDHYVTDKALDGLFALLADQEKQIRTNPVARTTDLLKKVFSR